MMSSRPINRIAIYVTIITLFLLEMLLSDKMEIFGARPELLLLVTVFFGFHFGMVYGVEVGLVSGILKDLFSITGFGVNALSFLLVGFLAGYLKNKLFKENFFTQSLLSMMSVCVIAAVYFIYFCQTNPEATLIISGNPFVKHASISAQFWRAVLYKGLYTGCIAPPLFFVMTRIFEKIY